jgi:3-oxoacyl-[acyl-carrier protein] reductase
VPGDVETLIGRTLEQFGRLDCVINNAGIGSTTPLEKLDAVQFETVIRVNLLSAFLVSQAAVPHMKTQGGRLIFMSSLAARTGGGISAAYAASKAGLEGLMHYYATYLLADRITANAIAPALIASDMVKAMNLPSVEAFPLGRLGQPDEIWPAVRMILETEYMTGQTIHINAGRYMT